MRFSIVVPIYNGEQFVKQCIESVINQTYPDWECLFVDDGSTDQTYAKLQLYSQTDKRIKLIRQNNKGAAVARKTGIDASTGQYVCFLDADDCLEINALLHINEAIEKSPDSDILVYGMHILKNGEIIKTKLPLDSGRDPVSYLRTVLTGRNGWELCGKCFKRSVFDPHPKIASNVRIGEDAAVLIQLITKANVVCIIQKALYNYIQYSTSTSKKKSQRLAEETIEAAIFIRTFLEQSTVYPKVYDLIGAMFLLFFSNSARRGLLRSYSSYFKQVKHYITLKSLIQLPFYKRVYVLLNYFLILSFR